MHLHLENFRQHKLLDLIIPDSGLVRIDGDSGAGKSTILDAIYWVWYGNVDDITPWEERSTTKGVLEFNNVVVTRTKNPHSLILKVGSDVLRDDAAQAEIDRINQMEDHEFNASSYIHQAMEGSLLSLTPAEQLKFVQALALGGDDPEIIKSKISEYISNLNSDIKITDGSIESLSKLIKDSKDQIDAKLKNLPENPIQPTEIFDQNELKKTEDARKEFIAYIKEVRVLLEDPYFTFETRLTDAHERHKAVHDKNEEEIKKLSVILSEIDKVSQDHRNAEITVLAGTIKDKEKYNDNKAKLIREIKKFTDKYPEFEGLKISSILPDEIENLNADAILHSKYLDSLKDRLSHLNSHGKQYSCPACDVKLGIKGDILIPHSSLEMISDAMKAKAASDVDVGQKTLWGIQKKINDFEQILKNCEQLKVDMGADPSPMSISDLNLRFNTLATVQKNWTEIVNKISSLHNEIQEEFNRIIDIEQKRGKKPKSGKESLLVSLSQAEECLDEKNQKLVYLSSLKDQWNRFNSDSESLKKLNQMIEVDQVRLGKDQDKLIELNDKKGKLNNKLAAAKKSKELADFASISACDLTLENINENARNYLDKFFPEDGTSIVLNNTTVLKTGAEKPKLSINIYHKGKEAKKLRSLSGGERSRAILAFQMALSEMYKSPLLLVDEGFAGLPLETKAECLECLKEFSKNRLVIVVEHGISDSIFDEVIKL